MWNKILDFSIRQVINKLKWWKRSIKFYLQHRMTPTSAWNLNYWIAERTWPKLIHMYQHIGGHPYNLTYEQWKEYLFEMAWALRELAKDFPNDPGYPAIQDREYEIRRAAYNERFDNGLYLFGTYLNHLWY